MTDMPSSQPRRPIFRRVGKLFWIIVFTYLFVVLFMCIRENSLVFGAETAADHWENPPDPAIEEVTFPSADGTSIHAWYLASPGSTEVLLLCHGNGGNLSYRGGSLSRFRQHLGCSALVFDYPGYGKSGGQPTEKGCYDSAEAALTWLRDVKGVPTEQVILYGESLGGGVAVEMAARHAHRALVLVKTFTDLPSVAQLQYRWLPVKLLMRNRFDNLSKIANVTGPTFVTSATNDEIVPYSNGEVLFGAAREPKAFFPLAGQNHGDKLPDELMTALRRFLDQHPAALAQRG